MSGHRQGRTAAEHLQGAIDSMRTLNRAASEVLVARGVAGATDVTGFGLLGHGLEMARASGTRFVFEAAALPTLPGALELAEAGVETGGAAHNRRFVAPALTRRRRGRAADVVTLAHDPQTSRRPARRGRGRTRWTTRSARSTRPGSRPGASAAWRPASPGSSCADASAQEAEDLRADLARFLHAARPTAGRS